MLPLGSMLGWAEGTKDKLLGPLLRDGAELPEGKEEGSLDTGVIVTELGPGEWVGITPGAGL